jgi:hypothetical protein
MFCAIRQEATMKSIPLTAAALMLGAAHAPAYADCILEPFSIPYFDGSDRSPASPARMPLSSR